MTALNTYRRWLARVKDDALRAELSALDEVRDAAQIETIKEKLTEAGFKLVTERA